MSDQLASGYSSSDDLAEDKLALVRGMFVKAKLHCSPKRSLAVIPESVLRPGKQVWLIRDNKLAMETIRIARIEDGQAFIDLTDSSLRIGDQIVSSPVPGARNGLAVSLKSDKPKRGKQQRSGLVAGNEGAPGRNGKQPPTARKAALP